MKERITPNHEHGFPRIPQHTRGLVLLEHLRKRNKYFTNGNMHHLFFEEPLFSGDPVLKMLRDNPLCIVVVDHSWHRLIHERFDRSPVPNRDVALSFLDEARVVEHWIRDMRTVREISSSDNLTHRALERIDELNGAIQESGAQVSQIEVMPFDMRASIIAGIQRMALEPTSLVRSLV